MTLYELTEREQQDLTRHRDAQSANAHEVHFTDVDAWAASLERDLLCLDNPVIWYSITVGPSTLDQAAGHPVLGGDRLHRYFGSRYVEASYQARGAMHKLSRYCGIVLRDEAPANIARQAETRLKETAEAMQLALRQVSVVLGRHPGLDVRSGGAMHLHNPHEPWQAHPNEAIEALPETRCGVCNVVLHLAGGIWKDERNRTEETRVVGKHHNGLPKHVTDHVHRPAGVSL